MSDTSGTKILRVRASDRRRLRVPWSALIASKGREYWLKARGRRIRGQGLIAAAPDTVEAGFSSLGEHDFACYNLPQVWVESRQIPRVLDRRVPREDARILDLGCGPGSSTELICRFARPSWTIVGYDLIADYIAQANRKVEAGRYCSWSGALIRPRFVCQRIERPLFLDGAPLADNGFDLALAGGVVGLYMQPDACRELVKELRRVIRPGGFIALDAGPSIPRSRLRAICQAAGFVFVDQAKSFVLEPRPKLVFRKPR